MPNSIQASMQRTVINLTTDVLGGKPMGEAIHQGKGVHGGPSLADLQDLQKLVDSARGQVDQTLGSLKQAIGQFSAKPGCISPGSIPAETMNNPLQQLMSLLGGLAGGGNSSGAGPAVKHAKAPIVGDGQWPQFASAANNRCSGHNPLFDGSNHAPESVVEGEEIARPGIAPAWLIGALKASGIPGAEFAALLDRAPLDIRANRLKSTREALAQKLPIPGEPIAAPDGLRFPAGTPAETWPQFSEGLE